MVRGLDLFRQFFAAHADQYVLIGATKDIDVVLHIEALGSTRILT